MADFEAIYTLHFNNVYKYVFSLCRDEALAEEITQEAFFKAMEHLSRFDGKCTLYVWLCQIAKNTYYTYLKKQKRFVPETDIGLSWQTEPDFEVMLFDKESAWMLHKLLHRLDEPYKEVFSLRVFGELPFYQIGELFGKSDSWARLIFYRAKNELRRGFDERKV
ncbi:MAG: sigma-70 family RNA polymerase sigma factor [Oscillospiraceae bacterium]|nr:sigma-70 family RNA polymerase sigma factor [Oscillospiraceae bacterium]